MIDNHNYPGSQFDEKRVIQDSSANLIGQLINPLTKPQLLTRGNADRKGCQIPLDLLNPEHSQHSYWMQRSLEIAAAAGMEGDVPVGAIVVDREGRAIAQAENRKQRDGDPTGHAEILALRAAGRSRGNWHLNDCTLYVTLEPCPMCTGALINARIGLLVFGTMDSKAGSICSVLNVPESAASNHRLPVIGGVLMADCQQQLQHWFHQRRMTQRA